MKRSTLLLIFFFLTLPVFAQTPTVTVDATGEVQLPADLVIFEINITVTGHNPKTVFQAHKKREETLAALIHEKGIQAENLQFQPMNIRSIRNQREVIEYRSSQHVSLTLDDFELFEEMQLFLIENGFDSFRGHFSSEEMEEGTEEALKLAMENARRKAEIIASSLNASISGIVSVEHSASPISRRYEMEQGMMRADGSSLMEFEQNISVTSSVKVTYEIE